MTVDRKKDDDDDDDDVDDLKSLKRISGRVRPGVTEPPKDFSKISGWATLSPYFIMLSLP